MVFVVWNFREDSSTVHSFSPKSRLDSCLSLWILSVLVAFCHYFLQIAADCILSQVISASFLIPQRHTKILAAAYTGFAVLSSVRMFLMETVYSLITLKYTTMLDVLTHFILDFLYRGIFLCWSKITHDLAFTFVITY